MATWFTENRSGSASISDKIYLQLETAQQASHIYIANVKIESFKDF